MSRKLPVVWQRFLADLLRESRRFLLRDALMKAVRAATLLVQQQEIPITRVGRTTVPSSTSSTRRVLRRAFSCGTVKLCGTPFFYKFIWREEVYCKSSAKEKILPVLYTRKNGLLGIGTTTGSWFGESHVTVFSRLLIWIPTSTSGNCRRSVVKWWT